MVKKRFKAVELNCLDEATIREIRKWRNQDFVRRNMFTQDEISEENHMRWVENIRKDVNRHVFVFYLDDIPFGVENYTYDPEKNHVEIGNYLIDEEFQALGYGVIMTYFGLDIMYNVLGYENLYAEIIEYNKNAGSVSRFFGEQEEYKNATVEINGQQYRVNIVRGTKQDWNDFEKQKLGKLVLKFAYDDYEVIK